MGDATGNVNNNLMQNILSNDGKPPVTPKPKPKPSSLQDLAGKSSLSQPPIISIQQLSLDFAALQKTVLKQGEFIRELQMNVEVRDAEITKWTNYVKYIKERTDALMSVKDRVQDELRKQVDKLQQFTRRPCVSIAGIPKERGESFEKLTSEIEKIFASSQGNVSMEDVDKFHRNGPVEGNDQEVIMRFKTHSAKEVFYNKRKTVDVGYPVYIKPSLCDNVRREFVKAKRFLKDYDKSYAKQNPPEFVMADVHGNLLLKMKYRSNIGAFIPFTSADELNGKIVEAQPHFERYDNSMSDYLDKE